MKKILLFVLFGGYFNLVFSQTILSGPEVSWSGSTPTLGAYVTNSSGNIWSRVSSAAQVGKFTVGTTMLTLNSDINTVGYTDITVKFKDFVSNASYPKSQVKLEYSINSGSSWADAGFSSVATITIPSSENESVILPPDAEGITTLRIRITFSGSHFAGTTKYNVDDLGIYGTASPATYYNVAGTDLSNLANWGMNTDGTGTNPPSFNLDNNTFNVFNGSSESISSDLTIGGAGSKLVIGDGSNALTFSIPIGITLQIGSGTLDIAENGTLNNESDAPLPSFGTINTGSEVIFSFDTPISIPSASYYNLTLSGSGDKNLDGGSDYTITNTLNTSSLTGKIVLGSDKLNINGTVLGSGVISSTSSSSVEVAGSGNVGTLTFDPSNKTINSFTITSGTMALGSDITLAGTFPNLNIASGATLDAGAFTIDGTGVTELVDLQGTFKTANLNGFSSGASTTFTSNVNAPTMGASSTVEYNASAGSQTITPFPEVNAYANLTLSGAGTKIFAGEDFYISKDFTVSGTTPSLNSSSAFFFTGAAQTIAPLDYYTLNFSGSGSKTLSSSDSTRVNTTLLVEGTAQVVTNGKLVLQSTSGSTASGIIDNTASANGISGSVMVKRVLTAGKNAGTASNPGWFLSSPVQGITVSTLASGNPNMFEYINSKATNKFTAIAGATTVTAGKGYFVRSTAGKTNYYYGTVNSGDVTVNTTQGVDQFNLIGNPYPSSIVWDPTHITMTNIGSSGQYKVHNGTGYIPIAAGLSSYIAMGQAFFVESVGNGSVVFKNAARTITNFALTREESPYTNRLVINVKKNNKADMAVLWGQDNTTTSTKYDARFDGIKLAPNAGVPMVHFSKEGLKLDTYTYGVKESTVSVPVQLTLPSDTVYSLEFKDLNKIGLEYFVLLVDNEQKVTQDLRSNNTYQFSGITGSNTRFNVVVSKTITSINDATSDQDQISVFSTNGIAYLNLSSIPSNVTIRDAAGKLVSESASSSSTNMSIDLSSNPTGMYIATVELGNKVINKKFILNK